jgi:DNA-binding IclR family transcriptional regulator
MLYNQRDDYKLAEITALLNLPREQLAPIVNSLVKVNLLSTNGPRTAGELADDNVLSFNAGFTK